MLTFQAILDEFWSYRWISAEKQDLFLVDTPMVGRAQYVPDETQRISLLDFTIQDFLNLYVRQFMACNKIAPFVEISKSI